MQDDPLFEFEVKKMDLNELRKSIHLSASAVTDFLQCSLLYKFGRVDKREPEFRPDALEFGSVMHAVLADFHMAKMRGDYMTLKQLHECFASYWRKATDGRDDIRYAEGNSADSLLLQGMELLTVYHNKGTWKQFSCVGVEEAFSFIIDGCPYPVIGAIDLIEQDESGTVIITDFKTSARAYSLDEVNRSLQLTIYKIALKLSGYDESEILMKFDCLIKTKTPKVDSFYTTRDASDEIRARRLIIEVARGIEQGIFIPHDTSQNYRCNNCLYRNSCTEWFMEAA